MGRLWRCHLQQHKQPGLLGDFQPPDPRGYFHRKEALGPARQSDRTGPGAIALVARDLIPNCLHRIGQPKRQATENFSINGGSFVGRRKVALKALKGATATLKRFGHGAVTFTALSNFGDKSSIPLVANLKH